MGQFEGVHESFKIDMLKEGLEGSHIRITCGKQKRLYDKIKLKLEINRVNYKLPFISEDKKISRSSKYLIKFKLSFLLVLLDSHIACKCLCYC